MLATGGSDNHIHVWQLDQLLELGPLKAHTGTVSCLDFAAGKLVSGSYDTHVRVWQTEAHTAPAQRQTKLIGETEQNGWSQRIK